MSVLAIVAAVWIGGLGETPAEGDYAAFFADRPNAVLTKRFEAKETSKAVWRIVSPAMCDAFVNGTRITSTTLVPWTDFRFRVLEDVYDVTALVRDGENELRFELGNGWWNPLPMMMWGVENLREFLEVGEPCVRATLTLTAGDGSVREVPTDESWRAADGKVIRNNVYLGEKYDARFTSRTSGPARRAKGPSGRIVPRDGLPRTVVYRSWTAKRTWSPAPGRWTVDLGENFAGNVRMTFRGLKAGDTVTALYGEALHPDGTVNGLTTVAGQMKDPKTDPPGVAFQRDTYVAAGSGTETYEPRFTFHGFRYIELAGLAEAPKPEDFTALAYSADVRDAASFACSDARVNELREVCRRTFRSNLRSVQSDCPARERYGYGGDLAATAESFILNYDMHAFYRKVLRDRMDGVADCGGIIPYITPRTTPKPTLDRFTMGWSVDVPIVVDLLVRYYGDLDVLTETYPTMVRFIDRCGELFDTAHVPPCRFGDHEALEKTENYNTALCHYHQFLTLTARFARRLGRTDDAARFARMAGELEREFAKLTSYVSNPGYVGHGRQGDQSFALYHGMLAPELRAPAYQLLRKDVIAHEYALSTGFFSTQYLLEVLTDNGDAELAGRVVTHRGFPGWFHMMDRGATTLWETWAETDDIYSQNHPMFGSVAAWLMRGVLGIRVADDAVGCDKVTIDPHAVAGITFASGHLDTPKGRISVSWKLVDGRPKVRCSAPDGVQVRLPDGMPPPGVVLRFDDAHPAAEWRELLEAFEAEGLKASFAVPAVQVTDKEQETFLRRAASAGHEIMDHTHDHTMYSYGCRDAAEFARFRSLPIVAETNAAHRLVGFRFAFDKKHPGNFTFRGFVTNGVLVVSPDVAKRLKRPNKIFIPSLGRFCGFFDDAGGHIGLRSFYTYRIRESFDLPEGELLLCDHRAFSIGDDVLRFQAARSREAFRRIGLPDPKVWIQPGGWDPLLPVDSFRRIYEREFGYRVADCIPGSSPKWNGDPQASDPDLARFTFRPDSYFDSAAVPPDAVRRKILEAQARGRGICLLSHTWVPPTMKGGRREWMDETKKLLRWLKDQRIPVRTMSEMADLLWGERKGAEK